MGAVGGRAGACSRAVRLRAGVSQPSTPDPHTSATCDLRSALHELVATHPLPRTPPHDPRFALGLVAVPAALGPSSSPAQPNNACRSPRRLYDVRTLCSTSASTTMGSTLAPSPSVRTCSPLPVSGGSSHGGTAMLQPKCEPARLRDMANTWFSNALVTTNGCHDGNAMSCSPHARCRAT